MTRLPGLLVVALGVLSVGRSRADAQPAGLNRSLRCVNLLEATHDHRAVCAEPAEQRHVVAVPANDLPAALQLAHASVADTRREHAGQKDDHVAFRRVEPPAAGVDPEDPAPQRRGTRVVCGPALVSTAEGASGQRAAAERTCKDGKSERDGDGGLTPSSQRGQPIRTMAANMAVSTAIAPTFHLINSTFISDS